MPHASTNNGIIAVKAGDTHDINSVIIPPGTSSRSRHYAPFTGLFHVFLQPVRQAKKPGLAVAYHPGPSYIDRNPP
ncbi:hypothetical protein MTBLM5_100020 [Magnetospirillum sp. LM-5]|nr:hypothetical protein MTBLM5_100020 [Magnetospirillum sp. LM-5]